MLVAEKLKHNRKTLRENVMPFKHLEKEISNKDVATKYGVPKNTFSTCVKNKEKLEIRFIRKRKQHCGQSYFQLVPKYAKSNCSIISCHDSRQSTYICKRIKC